MSSGNGWCGRGNSATDQTPASEAGAIFFFLPSYKTSPLPFSFPSFTSHQDKVTPAFNSTSHFKSTSRALSYPFPPSIKPSPTASSRSDSRQRDQIRPISSTSLLDIKMSTAVDQVTDSMAAATITDPATVNANGESTNAQIDAVNAIVAEGRRLYIGNLAYATTEGELNDFFKGFLV